MRDLIVFGEDWGALPSSTQHLVHHLAQNRKVLWINSIGLRSPKFNQRDLARVCNKLIRSAKPFIAKQQTPEKNTDTKVVTKKTRTTPSNLTVYNPITIPAPKSSLARFCAATLLREQLRPKIKELGLYKPILWASLPTAADVVGQLNESAVIYYCGDDFSGLAGVDHDTIAQHEKKLIEKSDLIIAPSDALILKFPKDRTRKLSHGVDFSLFEQSCGRADDLPHDDKPIAGFYGSLSSWLHVELIHEVMSSMPHWNFVFIGKEEADMSALKGLTNSFFLGPKDHAQLPSYCQHWQASLLPFRHNAQIMACNPLKLSEYLATGVPIISTDFPAIVPFRHLVQRADSADAFIEALEMSRHLMELKEFTPSLQNSVSGETWANKANTVSQWIEQL